MKFLPCNFDQAYLLPPSVKEVLGENHLCFFIHRMVEVARELGMARLGQVAIRVRDLIRQIAMEREITIVSGKVAGDYIHMLWHTLVGSVRYCLSTA